MSYVKLCQLICQVPQPNPSVSYQEDCEGVVQIDSLQFPMEMSCEVFDWGSEANFLARGPVSQFNFPVVSLESRPVGKSIRQAIFEQLVESFPTLVI